MPLQPNHSISIKIASTPLQPALLRGLQNWLDLGLITGGQLRVRTTARGDGGGDGEAMKLEVATPSTLPDLLAGLTAWLNLGLLANAQMQWEVTVQAFHPALLAGFDGWLELGILSEFEVKQLCREHLTCILPAPAPQATPASKTVRARKVVAWEEQKEQGRQRSRGRESSRLGRMVQSLMAELSVLWLLLLGTFMVVVSSGVLAASQWQKFPAFGQYGVLWLYTLGFGGASFWANLHPNLRLTAQALRIITLLLVPVNFLAMDSFGLWRNPLEWLVVAIAAFSLTALVVQLFRMETRGTTPSRFPLPLWNHLGLSYLHWGWAIPGFPLWATYLGVVGTAACSLSRPPEQEVQPSAFPFSLKGALVMYALAILLVRAIFIAQVDVTQLGLAVGICGALAARRAQSSVLWERIGGSLLGLGWLLSVAAVPWQALAVSWLALVFFTRRLLRNWLRFDLAAIFLIGLQALWLGWRLIPAQVQQGAIAFGTWLAVAQDNPSALLSLALFPYLVGIAALTDWLMQLGKRQLASFGGWVALFFGTILTLLSLVNPLLRTLNLAGSTVLLGTVTQRQWERSSRQEGDCRSLAAFTHFAGLLTVVAAIDWILPNLSLGVWATILLGLMVTELALSVISYQLSVISESLSFLLLLSQSAWHLSLSLAGLSYVLLWLNQSAALANLKSLFARPVSPPEWGIVWLLGPLAFTGVATWLVPRRQSASWLSGLGLGLVQLLTFSSGATQTIGLGIATGLMLVNSRYLQNLAAAALAIGFGLSWAAALLWHRSLGLPPLSLAGWLLAGAIAATLLWMLRHWLSQREVPASALYARAADGWAIALSSLVLSVLSINALVAEPLQVPAAILSPFWVALVAIWLMGATAYRSWQAPPSPQAIWLSILTLLVAQIPLLGLADVRLFGLGAATGLMLVHTRYLEDLLAAAMTVGWALAFIGACLWDGLLGWALRSAEGWLLAGAIALNVLWLLGRWLLRLPTKLARIYAQAADSWAIALSLSALIALTVHSLFVYWDWIPASVPAILAATLTLSGIAYRSWRQPNNWAIYGMGWSLELLALEVLGLAEGSIIALAIANLALGLAIQLLGDWWQRHSGRREWLSSWHILPLVYGALGSVLRWGIFSSWTGLSTLGLVLIVMGVGRRREEFKPLLYLAIGGISISACELVLYQVASLPTGERLLAMAALATTILYAYRLLFPWLLDYLRLTPAELNWVAHLHWGLGSYFLLAAVAYPITTNQFVGLGTGVFLTRYAIMQGRYHPNQKNAEIWVYLGILEAFVPIAWGATLFQLEILFQLLIPWAGAIAAIAAAVLYLLPWEPWGWPPRPWKLTALVLPLLGIAFSCAVLNTGSLLVVAGFYAGLAKVRNSPRLTYLSLLLVDWAAVRWLLERDWTTPFPAASLVGFSLLYIAWIDPACRRAKGKALRHALRLLGTGIICGAALLFHYQTGILPLFIGLVAVFAGLALRVRAFLYVGTLTLLLDVFYQLIILILEYPFLKWIGGLLLGISLIWIAASFENRRDQFTVLFRNWLTEFEEWE